MRGENGREREEGMGESICTEMYHGKQINLKDYIYMEHIRKMYIKSHSMFLPQQNIPDA